MKLTQRVIDTSGIITDGLRGPFSNEDTASIFNHFADLLSILNLKNQMLRSIRVAQVHCLLDILDDKCHTMRDGTPDNVNAWQGIGLFVKLILDGDQVLLIKVYCNKNNLRVHSVLCL